MFREFLFPLRCAALPDWIQTFSSSDASVDNGIREAEHDHGRDVHGFDQPLDPERAVEGPILNCFAYVFWRDLSLTIEIGDGSRNFQDSVVRASA